MEDANARNRGAHNSELLADFYGPIAIKEVEGKGRVLVVTEDVKACQMLLAEAPVMSGSLSKMRGCYLGVSDRRGRKATRLDMSGVQLSVHVFNPDPSLRLGFEGLFPDHIRGSPYATEEQRVAAIAECLGPICVDEIFRKTHKNAFFSSDGE